MVVLSYQSLTTFIRYLSFQAAGAGAGACVWFVVVLLEAGSCGPASRVLSGRLLWTNRDFIQRKAGLGGITAATDMERHVCGGESETQGGWKEKDKRGEGKGESGGMRKRIGDIVRRRELQQNQQHFPPQCSNTFWDHCSAWQP